MKILKFTVVLISFFLFQLSIKSTNNVFYDELKEELADIIAERFWANEQTSKYTEHIEKTTKRMVRKRVFNEAKNYVRNKVYNINKPLTLTGLHNKVFIYKNQKHPYYSQPFMQKNNFKIDLKFDFVANSFYSGGQSQNLSNLIFSQKNLTLKDILLVSKLTKEGLVVPILQALQQDVDHNPVHYFYILADQPILFDTNYKKQQLNLNYSHHFNNGNISVGFQLPFIKRYNKIKLVSDISAADREILIQAYDEPEAICGVDAPAGPNFFLKYNNLENFLIDILDKKGIQFNKNDSQLGIGDLSLFFNFDIEWYQVERLFIGANFRIPISNSRDTSKLWDPQLDDGEFFYFEPFLSVLFSESRWFNPHLFFNFSIGLPGNVNRRIPKYVSYNGLNPVGGAQATDLMIYGNEVLVQGQERPFINKLDANARRFADNVSKVNITPGPKMFLRVGNVLERFFNRNAFFDLYYDFGLKFKDYAKVLIDSDNYATNVITDNSWYFEHRVGGNYSYQIDDHFRFDLGALYTFAGENIEEVLRLNVGINVEF